MILFSSPELIKIDNFFKWLKGSFENEPMLKFSASPSNIFIVANTNTGAIDEVQLVDIGHSPIRSVPDSLTRIYTKRVPEMGSQTIRERKRLTA